MNKAYRFLLIALLLCVACNQENIKNRANNIEQMSHTENQLIELWQKIDSLNSVGIIDTTLINTFLSSAKSFSENNPEAPNVPNILLNAGQLTMVLAKISEDPIERAKNAKDALDIFNKFQMIYPENPNIKYCYFHRGTIYDDILEDYRSAENEFRELIHRFPDDSLSINISAYIQYLGKTPEQIMAEIEKEAK